MTTRFLDFAEDRAERYVVYDERRRARESEQAAAEELDDLRALTALEQHRRPDAQA